MQTRFFMEDLGEKSWFKDFVQKLKIRAVWDQICLDFVKMP